MDLSFYLTEDLFDIVIISAHISSIKKINLINAYFTFYVIGGYIIIQNECVKIFTNINTFWWYLKIYKLEIKILIFIVSIAFTVVHIDVKKLYFVWIMSQQFRNNSIFYFKRLFFSKLTWVTFLWMWVLLSQKPHYLYNVFASFPIFHICRLEY